MRYFEIYYPETGETDRIAVNVLDGETPEDAIIREGDALYEWCLVREVASA